MADETAFRLKNLSPEQLRAYIGRWKREIQNERTRHGLADEHPNISRRLARINVAERLLVQRDDAASDAGSSSSPDALS